MDNVHGGHRSYDRHFDIMSMLTFLSLRLRTKIGNSPSPSQVRCYRISLLKLVRVFRADNNDGNVVGTSRSIVEMPVVDSRVTSSALILLRIDNHTIRHR